MDAVPVWVLLVVLGTLGALVLFLLGVVRDHINTDVDVHAEVKLHASKLENLEDKELPKIREKLEEQDDRLHHHGREIQDLIAENRLRDRP